MSRFVRIPSVSVPLVLLAGMLSQYEPILSAQSTTLAAACAGGSGCAAPQRTVIDNEIGSIFTAPNEFTWAEVGAYVGDPKSVNFSYLSPDAIKVTHGRFHITKPSDDTTWTYFPYTKFKQYEASEVAAGRAPMMITATYLGKKRPVLWNWSLSLSNNVPTAASSYWKQPLNVQDDRYVKFWINQYARPLLWKNVKDMPNRWIGLDECAFLPDYYGVLDDTNHYVSAVKWDSPFPQSDAQYYQMIATFFSKLKQYAPDIKVMANVGSLKDWSQYPTIYANVDGIMVEEIYDPVLSHVSRTKFYNMVNFYSWAGAQGKVTILRTTQDPNNATMLRGAYSVYMLLRGKNSFFNPRLPGTATAMPPADYAAMRNALGEPTAALTSTPASGTTDQGARLYSRICEGGVVYVNYTGKAVTIPLTGRNYYDAAGKAITSLTLPDLAADYVLYSAQARAAKPAISPVSGSPLVTPMSLALDGESASTVVRYTTNGVAPTGSSAVYSTPLSLSVSTQVQALAQESGKANSFPNSMVYNVAAYPTTVQFTLANDSGTAGTYYPLVQMGAVENTAVTVNYQVQTGSTKQTGSITFNPGELYKFFPVATVAGSATTVTLTGASGAVLGSTYVMRYTAQ